MILAHLRIYLVVEVKSARCHRSSLTTLSARQTLTLPSQEFQLLVLGHSLGAGTATLLSFMLRDRYPNIRCFAYGPPGGLLR